MLYPLTSYIYHIGITMFKSFVLLIKSLLSVITTTSEAVEINAKSFKEISHVGLIKSKNMRINAAINAKADQAASITKFKATIKDNKEVPEDLKKTINEVADKSLKDTSSLDDLL